MDDQPSIAVTQIVQSFKSRTTVEYIQLVKERKAQPFDRHVWQRSFYDHVVRNERDYREIWAYIDENPVKWRLDRFYI